MLTVFILQLRYAGPAHRRRVPSWMRRLFVFRVGTALGVRHRPISRYRPSPAAVNQAVLLSAGPCRRARPANSVDLEVGTVSPVGAYLPLAVRSARESSMERADSQQQPPGRETARADLVTRHLTIYLDRQRAEQEFEDIITEWQLLALIFDRLMFWVFLIGTATSTIFILVVLPLTKPNI